MEKRPPSAVAKLVESRLKDAVIQLGGLEDKHLKFLTYYLKYEMKVPDFKLVMNYQSKPKVLTVHVFDKNGSEVYLKPKRADMFGKMVLHLGLTEWIFKFAERDQ